MSVGPGPTLVDCATHGTRQRRESTTYTPAKENNNHPLSEPPALLSPFRVRLQNTFRRSTRSRCNCKVRCHLPTNAPAVLHKIEIADPRGQPIKLKLSTLDTHNLLQAGLATRPEQSSAYSLPRGFQKNF